MASLALEIEVQKFKELFERVQSLTLDFEEMRQRVRVVERHILLPIKLLAAPFVVWAALSHLWKAEVVSHWDATMHAIYLFFLAYFMISVAWAILIWGMNDLKQWQLTTVVFAGIVTDIFFLSGLMVASKGFDSPIFWLFALWIVHSVACLPSFAHQLSANTIIFIVYVAAGILENWAVSADGFEREDFVESVVLRIFFLIMLSACSMGMHLVLVRQKQVREEAQEFLLRQEQIRANGRLAAEIAHQLKNPLGIINNVVYIIQRKVERGKTDIQGQIQIIREEIDRSDRIITDLMGYAKLAEGNLERLDINNELDWAASQVFPKGSQFGIQIIREYAQGLPNILMQRSHLSEVLMNLLSNARDILVDRGQIALRTRFGQNYAVIVEVADNGPGMEPDILPQIWTPYFTTKKKGTGLGLAIVKHNVEMYGGHIEVYSEPGKGTCFTIELPARSFLKLS